MILAAALHYLWHDHKGTEMQKLIFILLISCSITCDVLAIQNEQRPTAQTDSKLEDQVDVLKNSVVEFYSQFQLKELEIELCIQNGGEKVPVIKGRGSCFSDGSMRWLEAIQRRRKTAKVVDARELLMNGQGLFVTVSSSYSSEGNWTPVTVKGKTDWRSKVIENQFRTFWFGYFWRGDQFKQVTCEEFWESAACSTEKSGLRLLVGKGSPNLEFNFRETSNGQFEVVDVTQKMALPDGGLLTSIHKVVRKDGKITGWEVIITDEVKNLTDHLFANIIASKTLADESSPLEFKAYDVPNGSEAFVFGKRDTYFEYQDGKVVETVDGKPSKKFKAKLNATGKEKFGLE